MKNLFIIYALVVFFASPLIIISLMKHIQIQNARNAVLLIVHGTATFLSILFSLGIIINRTKLWYMGFSLTIIFSVLSLVLLILANKHV